MEKRSKIIIFEKKIGAIFKKRKIKKDSNNDIVDKVRCTWRTQQCNTTRQEVLSRSIQSSSYLICRLLSNEFIDRGPSPPSSP